MGKKCSLNTIVMFIFFSSYSFILLIVENFQLGRIQDCLQHFATLQENIVSMANELDNFPTEDSDAYKNLDVFPDRIMRDDALDKFLPFEKRNLPPSPLIAACAYCAAKVSDVCACHCMFFEFLNVICVHLFIFFFFLSILLF